MIKEQPEDFKVREVPITFSGRGWFIYELKKVNVSLHFCLNRISSRLHIPVKKIGYAGLKDKKAVTSQFISLSRRIRDFEEESFSVTFVSEHSDRINMGDLEGNEFKICLKGFSKSIIKSNYVPNYFDEQRFSKNNVEVGLAILRGEFKKACKLVSHNSVKEFLINNPSNFIGALRTIPRRLLSLYIHSVQSKLFNDLLADYIKTNYSCFKQKYSVGEFYFPRNLEKIKQFKLPLMGFRGNYDSNSLDLLEENNLDSRNFIIKSIPGLSSEGSERSAFVEIKNLQIKKESKNTFLSFSLPKGAYATIVVRFLTNTI